MDGEQQTLEIDALYIEGNADSAPKTETPDVVDFLKDVDFSTPLVTQRVRRHRARQRATKLFTECLKCGQPLDNYNTRWGTDDYTKAICKACKKLVCCVGCHCPRVADGQPCCAKGCTHPRLKERNPSGCLHPRLKEHTFSLGRSEKEPRTIRMCPDCTTFDDERHSKLNFGEPKERPTRPVRKMEVNYATQSFLVPVGTKMKDRYTLYEGVKPPATKPNMHGASKLWEDHEHTPFDSGKWTTVPLRSCTQVATRTLSAEEYEKDDRLLLFDLLFEWNDKAQKVEVSDGFSVSEPRWKRPDYKHLSALYKSFIGYEQWQGKKEWGLDDATAKDVCFTVRPRVRVTPNLNKIWWQQAKTMWPGHMYAPHRGQEFDGGTELVPWHRNEPNRVPVTPPVQRKLVKSSKFAWDISYNR